MNTAELVANCQQVAAIERDIGEIRRTLTLAEVDLFFAVRGDAWRMDEAKARLKPTLSPGNVDKTMAAPVTVIVAKDTRFFDYMPEQFPAVDAKPMFEADAGKAQGTATLNSGLQGGYLILAARLLGLDCGPMAGFDATKLDAEFFADGRFKSTFLVNLGYGDASGNRPRGPRLAFDTVAKVI